MKRTSDEVASILAVSGLYSTRCSVISGMTAERQSFQGSAFQTKMFIERGILGTMAVPAEGVFCFQEETMKRGTLKMPM